MAKRKIIWSRLAEKRLFTIFESDIRKGNGKSFSINLYKTISKQVKLLLKHPDMGVKTTEESIDGLIIGSYIIFYEVVDNKIIIYFISEPGQKHQNI